MLNIGTDASFSIAWNTECGEFADIMIMSEPADSRLRIPFMIYSLYPSMSFRFSKSVKYWKLRLSIQISG